MESYVKPPEALSLIGNVSENWRRFWQRFDLFMKATDLDTRDESVKTTEYKDQEEMVRDRIVMGVYNKTTQERLLRESSLSLTKAIDFCRAVEISKEQAKQLQAECEVTAIRRERPKSEKSYETRKENQCSYCGYKQSSEEEEVYIDNVEMKIVGSLNKARATELMWSETINVEGQEVLFKLDTGAEVNVLTYETVHRLGLGKNIRKTKNRWL
ncbi:hypothetical protein QE152_g40304 [Popillia japonica]|uniref:Peptidase A2 domain-containing protein n=1 Tax=Popillia japonica TaxID=7064 RepID=A0AAW1HSB2_POPJA